MFNRYTVALRSRYMCPALLGWPHYTLVSAEMHLYAQYRHLMDAPWLLTGGINNSQCRLCNRRAFTEVSSARGSSRHLNINT